ncbi:MAG: hypothetical protein V1846_00105 [Candidatus Komeilibacteria bacterium]
MKNPKFEPYWVDLRNVTPRLPGLENGRWTTAVSPASACMKVKKALETEIGNRTIFFNQLKAYNSSQAPTIAFSVRNKKTAA